MNARIIHCVMPDHPLHPEQCRRRELDASFLRRVRSATYYELRTMQRAHSMTGHEDYCGGCWRCVAIRRALGEKNG